MESRRSAARELALITFSQLGKNPDKWVKRDFAEIIEKSVEILTGEAEDNIQNSVRELTEMRDFIHNYEVEHADNLERPIGVSIIPVPMPMTSDITARIDSLLLACEKMYSSMEVIQMAAMAEREDVKAYTLKLIKTFLTNKEKVDEKIQEHAKGWDVDRLLKLDRDILRISISELLFLSKEIPPSVSINEAVELSKKYGEEESSSFINGILRQVYDQLYAESPSQ